MKRAPIPTIVTAIALVAVLLAYAFTFRVRFSENAVRVLLGKADDASVVREPGIYPRWPWPIESVQHFDKRMQTLDAPEGETKTRDGKNVIVGIYAIWRISDPLRFHISVESKAQAEAQLRSRINQVRAAVIGRQDMSAFVSLDEELVRQSYARIEEQMLSSMAEGVQRDYGVELVRVGVRRITLPQEVTQKVFEQMSQEREAQAVKYREEGTSIAEAIRARAESTSRQIMAFANRKAAEIESTGIQASTHILERIESQDRDFFAWLRRLDTLEKSLKERSTIFLDSGNTLVDLFMRPPSRDLLPSGTAPAGTDEPQHGTPEPGASIPPPAGADGSPQPERSPEESR